MYITEVVIEHEGSFLVNGPGVGGKCVRWTAIRGDAKRYSREDAEANIRAMSCDPEWPDPPFVRHETKEWFSLADHYGPCDLGTYAGQEESRLRTHGRGHGRKPPVAGGDPPE